jgi:hypothetical protein
MGHESGHILIPPKRVATKTKKTKKEKVARSSKSKKRG